jgi:hypothetical protein
MKLPNQDGAFWRSLNINYERVTPVQTEQDHQQSLGNFLFSLPPDNLSYIGQVVGVPVDVAQYHHQNSLLLAKSDARLLLACLKEFGDKKPRSIELFFEYQGLRKPQDVQQISSFLRVLMIYQKSPESLKDLLLLDRWMNRSSDVVYCSESAVSVQQIERHLDSIVTRVAKDTKTPFKLRASYGSPDGLIVLIYRQDPGRLLEGYNGLMDFIGAKAILFRCSEAGPVSNLEVRTDLVTVREALVHAVSDATKIEWTERTDNPFSSYDTDDILQVVRSGGIDRSLAVLGMEFGSVDLKSPNTRITLEADEDIGDSIAELSASFGPLTNIKSLLDLRKIRIRIHDNNGERTILVKQLTSGAVSFVLDDRKLLPTTVTTIGAGFKARFKLPLNTPIDHSKFAVGEARGLDSLFATDYEQNVPDFQKDRFKQLRADGLIKPKAFPIKRCKPCGTEVRDGSSNRCRQCGRALEDDGEVTRLVVDEGNARDLVYEILNRVPGWKAVEKNGHIIIEGEKYDVFTARTRKSQSSGPDTSFLPARDVAVYVTTAVPTSTTVERFQRSRHPVFIVYVGKAALACQRDRLARLHGETLGELIVKNKKGLLQSVADELNEVLASSVTRLRNGVESARERVRRLIRDGKPTDYNDTHFEDDCWALLRSVIEYTEKWGADKLMKPLPDGYVDLDYSVAASGEYISTWTYDAKLTEKEEGYDLLQAERRKMHEYLNKAFASRTLNPKWSSRKYRGHILISNQFNPNHIPKITEYLRTNCRDLVRNGAKVRFLDAEALLHLSLFVDMWKDRWSDRRNILLEAIDGLFDTDEPHITVAEVEKSLVKALEKEPERPTLDPEVVVKDILG